MCIRDRSIPKVRRLDEGSRARVFLSPIVDIDVDERARGHGAMRALAFARVDAVTSRDRCRAIIPRHLSRDVTASTHACVGAKTREEVSTIVLVLIVRRDDRRVRARGVTSRECRFHRRHRRRFVRIVRARALLDVRRTPRSSRRVRENASRFRVHRIVGAVGRARTKRRGGFGGVSRDGGGGDARAKRENER